MSTPWIVEPLDIVARSERAAPSAPARGREGTPEETGGRSHARQTHAVEGASKKSLRPSRRRELAGLFQTTFHISCVRACHVAQGVGDLFFAKFRALHRSAPREAGTSDPARLLGFKLPSFSGVT